MLCLTMHRRGPEDLGPPEAEGRRRDTNLSRPAVEIRFERTVAISGAHPKVLVTT